MEGVQILNQFEVVTKYVFGWQSFWAGVLIGAIVGLVAAIIFGITECDWEAFGYGCLFLIPIMAAFVGILSGGVLVKEPVAQETRYEVSINEEVNMQEFMNKYEIVETRGSIYTVREK